MKNLGPDSALAMEVDPKIASWGTIAKTNAILADIFDAINTQTAVLISGFSGKQYKKPKKYPRPFAEDKDKKHFGSAPLPADELEKWFQKKREEHEQRN